MKIYYYPEEESWKEILQRPADNQNKIDEAVRDILDTVRIHGDKGLTELTEKFDHWKPHSLLIEEKEFAAAKDRVSSELQSAILLAKANIEKFHSAQREEMSPVETSPGIICWRKSVAIQRVGLYIPGGSAPLISTLLMLAIPAKLAGCEEIVVCTPAKNGEVHPAILYAASLLGIKKLYKTGGAQAIAAMAFGTRTIPKVDKIFGPGNRYVTRAKQMVNDEGIAIDMPAGPSEVMVFADDTCVPSFVASDLLSQAEHGADSQVLLVTISEETAEKVTEEIEIQKKKLDRLSQIDGSLFHSSCVVLKNAESCFDMINKYAPEHLIIASQDPESYAGLVINAGSVFLGNYSPESAGDYVSGPNHTLPTNGFAKAYSGVSLDSFIRKITFQKLSREGLSHVKNAIVCLAEAEQLTAHARAVLKRFE